MSKQSVRDRLKMVRMSTRLIKKQPAYKHVTKRRRLSMPSYTARGLRRLDRLSVVVVPLVKSSSLPFLKGLPRCSAYVIKYPYMRPRALYPGLMVVKYGFVLNMRRSIAYYRALVRLS